jgi:xanthine dehydrogenase accessory factor
MAGMTENIYDIIKELLENRKSNFALAILISQAGSTPRHTGTKMIIQPDGSISGTIGGGLLEKKVIEDALEIIKKGKPELLTYHLTPETNQGIGMTCGGTVSVFIDLVNRKDELLIIGAGHIGVALSKMAAETGFNVVIAEDRPEYALKERFPEASAVYHVPIDKIDEFINQHTLEYVSLVNRHADCDIYWLKAILAKKEAKYVGCIGSKSRLAAMKAKLTENNISAELLESIYGPIGINIGAETPEEIAVSILSQIISVKRNKPLKFG